MTAPPTSAAPAALSGSRRVVALDGLRAIAIVPVMLSHVHPTLLKGGAIGVDLFFALSGFLICSRIRSELQQTGGFSARRFYARRALRLFPALYAMLAVLSAYLLARRESLPTFFAQSGVAADPSDLPPFLAAAATYTTNLFQFDQRPLNLVGHTWSLGVEEQFYILAPLMALALIARRRWAVTLLLAVALVAIFGLRVAGIDAGPLLTSRPEGIMLGTLLGLFWEEAAARLPRAKAYAVLGALAFLFGCAAVGRVISFDVLERGGYTLLALGCTGLVALTTVAAPRALTLEPLVAVGTISYGLYIWHLPIFRIVAWEMPAASGIVVIVIRLALASIVAVASWFLVERTFLHRNEHLR